MIAWFKNEVEAPIPSNAACSLRAKASIGTLRETGKTATVFKFVLLAPNSEGLPRPGVAFESTSVRTLDAIMRKILSNNKLSLLCANLALLMHTVPWYEGFCKCAGVRGYIRNSTERLTLLKSH